MSFKEINGFFIYPDQEHFFSISNQLGEKSSISKIFIECFVKRVHIEQEAAYFLFGVIAFVGNNFFDGNSFLLQSIYVSFLAILTNLFVYKILTYYIPVKAALKYTCLYAFFSFIFYYSPWILRDIHIAFLYSIGVYLIHTKFSLKTLLLFIPLIVITWEFRMAHGLFYLFMPLFYLYFRGRNHLIIKKIWKPTILLGAVLFLFIIIYLIPNINSALANLSNYQSHTTETLNDGIGAKLYSLPIALKETAVIIYSQLQPLPPWVILENSRNIYQVVVGLIMLSTAIFWSFLFLFLILILFMKRSLFKKIPKELYVLVGISLIFFFLNTSNMNVRRIIAMYPITFALYAHVNHSLLLRNKMAVKIFTAILYIFLILMYLIIKYLV